LFVHRNVSNVVADGDPNCLSVIQYAVDVLHVRHIIVCGHFGCGGIEAALEDRPLGLIDNWLKYVRDVRDKHREQLETLKKVIRFNRLCELNVIEQALNVANTSIVRDAWARQQRVSIHAWIYSIENGLLRDLGVSTIELLTNSSVSYVGIAGFDISIAKTVEMDIATPISLGNTRRA
jgi:carbonic anhydrase